MKEYKNIKEIVELCKDEMKEGNKDISATLDYEDLETLVELYNDNKRIQNNIELALKDLEENGYWNYVAKRDLKITKELLTKMLEGEYKGMEL